MKKSAKIALITALCVLAVTSLFALSACACKHEWSEWTIAQEATCETEGEKTRSCNKCGESEKQALPALGHAEVIDEAVEATCTKTGLTEGKHCSRCNAVFVKQEIVKALGHKNKNGICLTCNEDISTKGLEYLDGEEDNTLILAGMGAATDKNIIIPSVYNGKKIVSIDKSCFRGNTNIVSVDIPDSVTSIGDWAFGECSSLTSITIPDSVTSIRECAFSGCSRLTSITIPDSVTSIGDSAFWGCSGLTSVTIGNSVTSIGNSAFYGCSGLTSVTIGNSVTSIGDRAFYGCSSLTSITIPDSVTSIGEWAFYDCSSLTSITIPDSVTSIGDGAFSGCKKLKEVNYRGTEEQWMKIKIGSYNAYLTGAERNYI